MHAKKGSGNIVYNELSQTLECGATNQIALFAINMQSAQFIMNINFTKNVARICHQGLAIHYLSEIMYSPRCRMHGGARVHKGSMATSSGQKTSSQSSDHLSMILERYCIICWLQRTNKGYRSLP